MVHKKYTYKDGKKFGPYYYETKRVDGQVITTYLGTEHPNGGRKRTKGLFYLALIAAVLVLIALAIFYLPGFTGKVSLDVDSDYLPGEQVTGALRLNLRAGELIPADSKILVNFGSVSKEFTLSELTQGELSEGNFYAENVQLEGSGTGFGIAGIKESYPEVDFELRISSEEIIETPEVSAEDTTEDVPETPNEETPEPPEVTEEPSEETTEGPVEETPESPMEEAPEESQETGEETPSDSEGEETSSDSGDSGGITGAAISESEFTVSGSVTKDNDFEYALGDEENAEIIEGSVMSDGETIGDDQINLEVAEGNAIVSTDYAIEEEGFGEDYLGEEALELEIDISQLGLVAENSTVLSIIVSYNDQVIVEAERDISVESTELIPEMNETNQTINETILPVLNESLNLSNEGLNVSVNTTQFNAILGQSVKWVKKVDVSEPASISVEIPASAENITIRKILKEDLEVEIVEENVSVEAPQEDVSEDNITEENFTESVDVPEEVIETPEQVEETEVPIEETPEITIDISGNVISGRVSADITQESGLREWFKKIFRFTGLVVEDQNETETQEILIEVNSSEEGAEIEYYTDAPSIAFEEETEKGKKVHVTSPEDVHYEKVLIYTNLSEDLNIVNPGKIRIYWDENETYLDIYNISDLDSSGIYDYVEWIAPHLSNQTFTIILITGAEHLDENKTFISDIYNEAAFLDDIWSETIPSEHYVRVTFEQNLTSENDITIYPRAANGTNISDVLINVYEIGGNETLAQFYNISEYEYNQIFLTNLSNKTQDKFDLHVLGGSLEFDHIIDPVFVSGSFTHDTSMTILDDDTGKFVLAWCEDTDDSARFRIWYSNGSAAADTVVIDDAAGDSCRIAATSLNNTAFVIAYVDWVSTSSDWNYTIFNDAGGIIRTVLVDADMNGNVDIAACAFNSTTFVTAVADDTDDDATFGIHNISAPTGHQIDVDTAMTPDATDMNLVDCSAFNSSLFGFAWYDDGPDTIRFTRRSDVGTNLSETSISTSTTHGGVATAALTGVNGGFAVVYCHQDENDISFNTFSPNGVNVSGVVDVDTAAGTCGTSLGAKVEVTALNTSDGRFAIVYDDANVNQSFFAVYNQSGTEILAPTLIQNTLLSDKSASILGYNPILGRSVCKHITNTQPLIISYNNQTTVNATWETYFADGTKWDGICIPPAAPNISFTSPTPENGSSQTGDSIFVNVSSGDSDDHYTFVEFNRDLDLWMRFDDKNSSGDPKDLSSYSRNGSLIGGAKLNFTEKYWGNASLSVYGVFGQYVGLPAGQYANITGKNTTISLWFKTAPVIKSLYASVQTNLNGEPRVLLGDPSGGTPALSIGNGSAATNLAVVTSTLNDSQWHHLVLVIRDNHTNTNVSSYVDGRLNRSLFYSINRNKYNNTIPAIGRFTGYGSFNGSIDEFMMFSRDLNATEAFALYNASANKYERNFTTLQTGNYNFTGYSVDKLGNRNQTETRTVTIAIADDTNPQVTIILPQNDTYGWTSLPFVFRVSSSENGTANYTLTDGVTNFSMVANRTGTGFNATNTSIADGQYRFRVYVNDLAGNINYTESTLFIFNSSAITQCGRLNVTNTAYTVIRNLSVSNFAGCYFIQANNVTVNLNRHSFTGDGFVEVGAYIGGANYSTVRNGYFINAERSIESRAGWNGTYRDLNISSDGNFAAGQAAIYIESGGLNNISRINITNMRNFGAPSRGVYLIDGTRNNSIYDVGIDNIASDNDAAMGIMFETNANDSTFHNIRIYNVTAVIADAYGVRFDLSGNNNLNNISIDDVETGIAFGSGSQNNVLTGFRINNSQQDSILFETTLSKGNILRNVSVINSSRTFFDLKFSVASVNDTTITDSYIENYTFTGVGGTLTVSDSRLGDIKFINPVNGSGNNFSADIRILNNSATVLSSNNRGFNISANVTLRGISTGFTSPEVKRDGAACGSICYNYTDLNAGTVEFNVSYWTNYSIGEQSDVTPPYSYLQAPANGSSVTYQFVSFNATFTDNVGLSSASFYLWNYSGVLLNFTTLSLTGTADSKNLTVRVPANATLIWNFQVNDTSTSSAFNNTNYSLTTLFLGANQCGTLTVPNKLYIQGNDITPRGTSPAPCINITAQNVTFNGNGYWIANATKEGTGIYSNQLNSTVMNANVTISGAGMILYQSTNALVKNNTFYTTGGIYLDDANGSVLAANTIPSAGGSGIELASTNAIGSYDTTIANNSINFSGANAILADVHFYTLIENNSITESQGNGIRINGGDTITIRKNIVRANTLTGLRIISTNTTIDTNLITFGPGTGILVLGGENQTMTNNTLLNNTDGIDVSAGGLNVRIVNNTVLGGMKGISLTSPTNGSILQGIINGTIEDALEIAGDARNLNIFNITIVNVNGSHYHLLSTANLTGARIKETKIGNYSFLEQSLMIFEDFNEGEIRFLRGVNGTGSNLTADVAIGNNSASVRSSVNRGLNASANITLRGISTTFQNPEMKRDGIFCGDLCYNYTDLNAGTVVFNVSYWTNYSIGNRNFSVTDCGILDSANNVYTQTANITASLDPCISIAAPNITFNGNSYTITEASVAVYINATNATVKNAVLNSSSVVGASAIQLDSANYSYLFNNSITAGYRGIQSISAIRNALIESNAIANITENLLLLDAIYNSTIINNCLCGGNSEGSISGVTIGGNNNTVIHNRLFNSSLTISGENNSIGNNTLRQTYLALSDSESTTVQDVLINRTYDAGTAAIELINGGFGNIIRNITIVNTSSGLASVTISANGPNGTRFLDMALVGNYTISGPGVTLAVEKASFGEVRFLRRVNGSGNNFSADIFVANNSAAVLSSTNRGLNTSANITLRGISTGFTSPEVKRDDASCGSICYNYTDLNAGTVVFNVSYWTNYSIGEAAAVAETPPLINFTFPTTHNASTLTGELNSIFANVSSSDAEDHYTFLDFNKDVIFRMRFDDLNGSGDPTDLSFYSRNGTKVNGPIQNLTEKYWGNASFQFDGINDFVNVSDDNGLFNFTAEDNFTVSFWANLNSTSQMIFLAKSPSTNSSWRVLSPGSGGLRIQTRNFTGALQATTIGNTFPMGIWVHVVFTRSIGNRTVYINGASNTSSNDNFGSYGYPTDPLVIGVSADTQSSLSMNGSLDEIMIFRRALDHVEVAALYNASATKYEKNFTGLGNGNYNFTGYAVDKAGTRNQTETRTVDISVVTNEAPNNPTVLINSTLGTNRTLEDLNCFATITDPNANALNVSVIWFNNTVQHLYVDLNNSYPNGTLFNTTLAHPNTTRGQNWTCSMRLFDGDLASGWVNSTNLTILNSPPSPTPTLQIPGDASTTTDRSPNFRWGKSGDDDNDTITYELNLTLVASSLCTDTSKHVTGIPNGSAAVIYELTTDLKCFYDNGDYYNWTARATDGELFSSWAPFFRVNLSSFISLTMLNDSIAFGSLSLSQFNDTSDDSPLPFLVENSGNALTNVTSEATGLWKSVAIPSAFYQFKIANYTLENGSFSWTISLTSYTNMPDIGSPILSIALLNYTNATDTAEIDINVTVPSGESPGFKNSTAVFTGSLAEG